MPDKNFGGSVRLMRDNRCGGGGETIWELWKCETRNQFWIIQDWWEIIDVVVGGQLCRSPSEPQSIIQHIVIVLSENTNTSFITCY